MMGFLRLYATLALALSLPLTAHATAELRVPEGAFQEGAPDDEQPRVAARLLVHPDPEDGGRTLRVGVLFEMDPEWHIYWRNPGDTGLPTELVWKVEDASVGPIAWPVPERFVDADLTSFGYSGRVLLVSRLQLDGSSGSRMVRAEASVLACRHECIPASFSLVRRLSPPSPFSPDGGEEVRAVFAHAAAQVPVPPSALALEVEPFFARSALRPGDTVTGGLSVRSCVGEGECRDFGAGLAHARFFPAAADDLAWRSAAAVPHPKDARGLVIPFEAQAFETADPTTRLNGVLSLQDAQGRTAAVALDLPIPRADAGAAVQAAPDPFASAPAPAGAGIGLLYALFLAFVGGLILNLMPCVLPVLAMKLFSITELSGHSRREVIRHGVAYTVGILVTMLALAGVVLALRAAGTYVGWGFQFQDPRFALVVSTVLVVFALNLFGVFEITPPMNKLASVGQSASGAWRSFFEGLLAVVLATPCSAPFLGTAVGFAFASSAAIILSIFAAIGLGLAAPYLLATLIPATARLVPRSGAWMLQLRVVLGFTLLATVVWLLWILGRSTGVDRLIEGMAFLIAVAFATWVYGRSQAGGSRAWIMASAAVVGLAVFVWHPLELTSASATAATQTADADEWTPFDPAQVSSLVAEGRPAFVYFTADWCITCAVNERVVLDDERIQAEFRARNVALFRADWTRRDEGIRRELARYGKAGVPLALVYAPGAPGTPQVLPELLSVDGVLEALRPK